MRIFLGGAVSRREFYEIERDVRAIADRASVVVVSRERVEVDDSGERFADEVFGDEKPTLRSLRDVDLLILCRSFPNEFDARSLEAIRRVAPLSPIILVSGVLCEGEGRSGEPICGVRRFYLDEWRARGRDELRRFVESRGVEGEFAKSPLATEIDLLLDRTPEPEPLKRATVEVAILADDPDMVRFLTETFEERGDVVRSESLVRFDSDPPRESEFSRVLVDVVDLSDPEFPRRLSEIKGAFPGVPVDLLVFSPRPDEIEFFERRDLWGRVRVVAKPFDLDYLLDWEGAR
ncbi:MAG: hypothetical protein IJM30_11110 [Thermoguttaceae bacterium]|nr:hypothetical protein [Thermoguttaceae bacterium]